MLSNIYHTLECDWEALLPYEIDDTILVSVLLWNVAVVNPKAGVFVSAWNVYGAKFLEEFGITQSA